MRRVDLENIIVECLKKNNGKAKIAFICRYIWENYESELRVSGDFFYIWQYEVRWAARNLRKKNIIQSAKKSLPGVWELK